MFNSVNDLYRCISDCWKVLALDPAIAADIVEKFLHILTTTPPVIEDQPGRDRLQVAALQPLVVSILMFCIFISLCFSSRLFYNSDKF